MLSGNLLVERKISEYSGKFRSTKSHSNEDILYFHVHEYKIIKIIISKSVELKIIFQLAINNIICNYVGFVYLR